MLFSTVQIALCICLHTLTAPNALCRYHRIEVLGALASVLSSWLVTGILVYEAIQRIFEPVKVNGKGVVHQPQSLSGVSPWSICHANYSQLMAANDYVGIHRLLRSVRRACGADQHPQCWHLRICFRL